MRNAFLCLFSILLLNTVATYSNEYKDTIQKLKEEIISLNLENPNSDYEYADEEDYFIDTYEETDYSDYSEDFDYSEETENYYEDLDSSSSEDSSETSDSYYNSENESYYDFKKIEKEDKKTYDKHRHPHQKPLSLIDQLPVQQQALIQKVTLRYQKDQYEVLLSYRPGLHKSQMLKDSTRLELMRLLSEENNFSKAYITALKTNIDLYKNAHQQIINTQAAIRGSMKRLETKFTRDITKIINKWLVKQALLRAEDIVPIAIEAEKRYLYR